MIIRFLCTKDWRKPVVQQMVVKKSFKDMLKHNLNQYDRAVNIREAAAYSCAAKCEEESQWEQSSLRRQRDRTTNNKFCQWQLVIKLEVVYTYSQCYGNFSLFIRLFDLLDYVFTSDWIWCHKSKYVSFIYCLKK